MRRAYRSAAAGDRRRLGKPWLALARRGQWVASAVLLALAGCAGGPPPAPVPLPEDAATAAMSRAETASRPAEAAAHYFDALRAAQERGDATTSRTLLDRLTAAAGDEPPLLTNLPSAERFEVRALALERALAAGTAPEAARFAESLAPQDAAQQRRAALLRARMLALGSDHANAALALIEFVDRLADGVNEDPALVELTAAAWRELSQLSIPALERLAAAKASTPRRQRDSASAWLTLARTYNAALSANEQRRIWQRWRAAHPRHALARLVPPSLAAAPMPLPRIALLVPLTGDYAAAAEAVRDGFVAAYLYAANASDADAKQELRVYDTAAGGVAAAYQRAIGDGASAIVGPLRKPAVGELAALSPTVPVVALNSLDDEATPPATPALHQLALAVEDEAAAIAAALKRTGTERIALFDSPGPWWERARRHFETELGTVEVVASATLRGVGGVTNIAGEVLGIDASSARHSALSALLGTKPEFVPARRRDIDAIVAFVDGAELMALKPALDFHFASDLPVYAPSRAVRGVAWQRLEGVRVCDIPWRLHPQPLRAAASGFAASRGAAADLFALGVDGFRVVGQLPRLVRYGEAIAGSTGLLRAGQGGLIRRTPAWGLVAGGVLRATPPP